MATAAIAAEASGIFLTYGKYRDDSWAYTRGADLFIATGGGGNPTETKPSGSGDQIRGTGHAYASTIVFFNPDQIYVEHV